MPKTAASGPPALAAQQVDAYRRDGYLVLRRVFTDLEIGELARESSSLITRGDLISKQNLRCRFQPHVETGEELFEVFDPVNDISPVCARIARDRRILDVLAAIYGSEACLFKDKLIYKPPGARGYDLHQDFPPGWPGFPETFVTVLVPIDACTEQNGATEVFPGYHRQGLLPGERLNGYGLPDDAVDAAHGVRLEMEAGDVAVFGCYVPHRSAPNRSDQYRRTLYISYNAVTDGGPQREKHYAEFREYMQKRRPAADGQPYFFR